MKTAVKLFLLTGLFLCMGCSSSYVPSEVAPPELNSGLSLIPVDSSFSFAERSTGAADAGDIAFINRNGPYLVRDSALFIYCMGETDIDSLSLSPPFSDTAFRDEALATQGMSYYCITADGAHVAKFRISAFRYATPGNTSTRRTGVLIDWVYNVTANDRRF